MKNAAHDSKRCLHEASWILISACRSRVPRWQGKREGNLKISVCYLNGSVQRTPSLFMLSTSCQDKWAKLRQALLQRPRGKGKSGDDWSGQEWNFQQRKSREKGRENERARERASGLLVFFQCQVYVSPTSLCLYFMTQNPHSDFLDRCSFLTNCFINGKKFVIISSVKTHN